MHRNPVAFDLVTLAFRIVHPRDSATCSLACAMDRDYFGHALILAGRRVAPGGIIGGGKSELHRARCRVTRPRGRDTRGRWGREARRRKVPQKLRPPGPVRRSGQG